MSGVAHLGKVSKEYQEKVDAYKGIAMDAAENEALHKSTKARKILEVKATRDRMSHAEAEATADADEHIAQLYRDRLISAAIADAHREKLRQLREQIATGRTYVASEREMDKMHAQGIGGAA